ncbi:MAG: hypothetical protein IJS03_02660 [Eubacterium sp.]|nr:hypothetical protein [Eubacterium sp.]
MRKFSLSLTIIVLLILLCSLWMFRDNTTKSIVDNEKVSVTIVELTDDKATDSVMPVKIIIDNNNDFPIDLLPFQFSDKDLSFSLFSEGVITIEKKSKYTNTINVVFNDKKTNINNYKLLSSKNITANFTASAANQNNIITPVTVIFEDLEDESFSHRKNDD